MEKKLDRAIRQGKVHRVHGTDWFGEAVNTTMIVLQGVGLVLALLAARWIFARLRPGFADMV